MSLKLNTKKRLQDLLNTEKLQSWRDNDLLLMVIVPRPVQSCVYEPDFFNSSISIDAHEDIRARLTQGHEHLSKRGFDVKVKIVYQDSESTVTQALQALNPDLLVAVRSARYQKRWPWLKSSSSSFLVDVSPCPVLIL